MGRGDPVQPCERASADGALRAGNTAAPRVHGADAAAPAASLVRGSAERSEHGRIRREADDSGAMEDALAGGSMPTIQMRDIKVEWPPIVEESEEILLKKLQWALMTGLVTRETALRKTDLVEDPAAEIKAADAEADEQDAAQFTNTGEQQLPPPGEPGAGVPPEQPQQVPPGRIMPAVPGHERALAAAQLAIHDDLVALFDGLAAGLIASPCCVLNSVGLRKWTARRAGAYVVAVSWRAFARWPSGASCHLPARRRAGAGYPAAQRRDADRHSAAASRLHGEAPARRHDGMAGRSSAA